MRRARLFGIGVVATLCGAGCAIDALENRHDPFPPGPIVDLEYPQDAIAGPGVPISDHAEADLVEPLLEHRTMYARYLKVLSQYYYDRGFLNKHRWAETELKDLHAVPAYSYGADVGQLKLRDIVVAGRQEVDIVEELVTHRKMYNRLLDILVRRYAEKEDYEKLACAERERLEASYIKPYQYLMAAMIPIETLRPQESIAEADMLFDEGLKLMKKGGYKWRPGMYNRRTMKRALNRFHTLITEYPTSDKIAEAAFYAGFIHKEYFYDPAARVDDNEIAVQYFERAFTWKPNITLQARFEAATVYDYRLHDRERALRLYQDVIDTENFVESNVRFAHARIRQLTRQENESMLPAERNDALQAPPQGLASPAAEPAPDVEPAPARPVAP